MTESGRTSERVMALTVGGVVGVLAVVGLVSMAMAGSRPDDDDRPAAGATAAGASTGFAASCTDRGLRLNGTSATASTDGVHVDASGPAGSVLYVRWAEGRAPTDAFIVSLEGSLVSLVMPIPPGPFSIGCFGLPFDANLVDEGDMTTAVVDASPYWADPGMRCPGRSLGSVMPSSTSELIQGAKLNADELIRAYLPALDSRDRLRPAFYGGSEPGAVAVIRGGEAIAVVWPRVVDGYDFPIGVDMLICDGVDLG